MSEFSGLLHCHGRFAPALRCGGLQSAWLIGAPRCTTTRIKSRHRPSKPSAFPSSQLIRCPVSVPNSNRPVDQRPRVLQVERANEAIFKRNISTMILNQFLSQFDGANRDAVIEYSKQISNLEADIIILMARKAACFYHALEILNLVHNSSVITTDRVLGMDMSWMEGKK